MLLRINSIAFPGLGIGEFDINSVAFSPFGVDIAWYALFITFGMVMCVLYTCYRAGKLGVGYEHILDMALYTILSGFTMLPLNISALTVFMMSSISAAADLPSTEVLLAVRLPFSLFVK